MEKSRGTPLRKNFPLSHHSTRALPPFLIRVPYPPLFLGSVHTRIAQVRVCVPAWILCIPLQCVFNELQIAPEHTTFEKYAAPNHMVLQPANALHLQSVIVPFL